MDLRPTILGSVYKGNFRPLPTDMAELTWEASQAVLCVKGCAERLFPSCMVFMFIYHCVVRLQVRLEPSPALVKPVKPKMLLTGSLSLPPLTATLLK